MKMNLYHSHIYFYHLILMPKVHLPLAFGGAESLRSQMPLFFKEYYGLKNNIEHTMLFSVHYIHAIPLFRVWWGEVCCDLTNTLLNGVPQFTH